MHALDTLAVLEYCGYLPSGRQGAGELPASLGVLQYGPTTEYVPKYTEFKCAEATTTRDNRFGGTTVTRTDVNSLFRPPAGLSILKRSLWLVDRDIKCVKWMQRAAPHKARVFRYGADAQETAATAAEVKKMHNVENVFECDGLHPSLVVECRCRSPNAVPATDNDPLDQQLERLMAVQAEYKTFVPFTERFAVYQARSTAADGVAVRTEEFYRGLHNVAFNNKNMVLKSQWQRGNPRPATEWKAPQGIGISNPATGAPFFGHQFEIAGNHTREAQQALDAAGAAARDSRTAAIRARAEFDEFVTVSETEALSVIGEEAAAALSVIRENSRNGFPVLACYGAVYSRAVAAVLG